MMVAKEKGNLSPLRRWGPPDLWPHILAREENNRGEWGRGVSTRGELEVTPLVEGLHRGDRSLRGAHSVGERKQRGVAGATPEQGSHRWHQPEAREPASRGTPEKDRAPCQVPPAGVKAQVWKPDAKGEGRGTERDTPRGDQAKVMGPSGPKERQSGKAWGPGGQSGRHMSGQPGPSGVIGRDAKVHGRR